MPFFNGETKMTAAAVQAKRSLMFTWGCTRLIVNCEYKFSANYRGNNSCLIKHQHKGLEINPFILKISLVILLGSTDNLLINIFPYSHQLFV